MEEMKAEENKREKTTKHSLDVAGGYTSISLLEIHDHHVRLGRMKQRKKIFYMENLQATGVKAKMATSAKDQKMKTKMM